MWEGRSVPIADEVQAMQPVPPAIPTRTLGGKLT